ncbi:sigma 54 modulation protein/ribosomal protein S30EA [Xanthomonas phage XbC2]|nr:sigma 54 modulation protein/ribosomal protein S30EA [Xanthomonas phage XbC2]
MFNHTIVYNDNIDVSEELEMHTIDAFRKVEKFVGETPVDFRTTYSKEGTSFKVHAHGTFDGTQFDAHSVDNDIYKSVDLMVAKLESQFRTAKSKRTSIDRDTIVQAEDESSIES